MLYFPWPYPDEVLGSLLVRACRHTGLPFAQIIHQLAGHSDRSYVSFLLPQFLVELGRETGLSPISLLREHTVFPYVASFKPPVQVRKLERSMLSGQAHMSSTTRLVTKALPFRRYCAACVNEDIANYGESYWHRVHLLPIVHVCPRHELPLIVTGINARRGDGQETHHWNYELPQEVKGESKPPALSAELLLDLARRSRLLLDHRRTSRHDWYGKYCRVAKSKGYVDQKGQVSGLVMAHDLHAFYGSSLLEEAHCGYTLQDRRSWPVLMVREQPKIPFSPVKHILLRTFLDKCPGGQKAGSQRLPGRRPRDFSDMDDQISQQVREAARVIRGYATVKELLTQVGGWELYRHRRQSLPKTAAVVREFKSSGRWRGHLSRAANLGTCLRQD